MLARLALIFVCLFSSQALAISIVGVIAAERSGVALIRTQQGVPPVVVRAGEKIANDIVVYKISRDFVDLKIRGRLERARVGEELTYKDSIRSTIYSGIERQGNQVRITSQLREQIVRRDLGKVLMQAAAVPYYINGNLRGFRLWDIDAGSVYDLVGFKDGDIVMAINESEIVDVGGTVRMLQSLRDQDQASVKVVRNGVEEIITISVW